MLTLLFMQIAQASEPCSRVAKVNNQEILIDLNSNQKGEGLRNYLEKDPISSMYLEKYRKGNEFHWYDAAIGTVGAALVAAGILANLDSKQRMATIISGSSLIAANFLISYTLKHGNEKNLNRAIEEYNKRNNPQINIGPLSYKNTQNIVAHKKIVFSKSWSF